MNTHARSYWIPIVAMLVSVLLTACGGGGGGGSVGISCGTPSSATLPVTHITASAISTATTWKAANVYVLDNSVTLTAPLTIEPGAVIKFATGVPGGTNLTVNTGGSITASGGSGGSIVFTSAADDSVGGDSNADGTATSAAKGDWGKIVLNASGSTFQCARFAYGGKTDSTLQIGGSYANSASIKYSTFMHNNGGNSSKTIVYSTDALGALDAGFAAAPTVITNNIFYDNIVPLSISGQFSVDDSNVFHNPSASATKNKYNGIFLVGNSYKAINGAITFAETEVPYVLAGVIDIPDGSQLTLGDDVIVKFFSSQDTLNTNYNGNGGTNTTAKLIANASSGHRIVFTSYKDDDISHGGDTNGDGTASSAAAGDWAEIVLNADGSSFDRSEFYYGGWDTAHPETLSLTTYSATVKDSIFAHNMGGDVANVPFVYGALDASQAKSSTAITGNAFYDNTIPLVMSGKFSLDDSNVFHDPANMATTNTYNGIFFTGNSANSITNITLSETEVPFGIVGDIYVTTGNTLTLGNNVVFKFGSGSQLTFDDSNNYSFGSNVVFTSLSDDTHLGDTNGNVSFSSWNGVRDASSAWITNTLGVTVSGNLH